jgi:hypothetical protein
MWVDSKTQFQGNLLGNSQKSPNTKNSAEALIYMVGLHRLELWTKGL